MIIQNYRKQQSVMLNMGDTMIPHLQILLRRDNHFTPKIWGIGNDTDNYIVASINLKKNIGKKGGSIGRQYLSAAALWSMKGIFSEPIQLYQRVSQLLDSDVPHCLISPVERASFCQPIKKNMQ
jgi:hypothetical protein